MASPNDITVNVNLVKEGLEDLERLVDRLEALIARFEALEFPVPPSRPARPSWPKPLDWPNYPGDDPYGQPYVMD